MLINAIAVSGSLEHTGVTTQFPLGAVVRASELGVEASSKDARRTRSPQAFLRRLSTWIQSSMNCNYTHRTGECDAQGPSSGIINPDDQARIVGRDFDSSVPRRPREHWKEGR